MNTPPKPMNEFANSQPGFSWRHAAETVLAFTGVYVCETADRMRAAYDILTTPQPPTLAEQAVQARLEAIRRAHARKVIVRYLDSYAGPQE